MKTEIYDVTGMTCAACQANVTRCVARLDGVDAVDVSLLSRQMTVSYDETKTDSHRITDAVQAIGYGAAPRTAAGEEKNGFRAAWTARQERAEEERNQMKRRLLTSVVLLVPLMYLAMGPMLSLPLPGILSGEENALLSALTQLLITIPIVFVNRRFYENGGKALWHRAPNMDSLVAVGSGASLAYGLFALFRMAYGLGHGDLEIVHEYAHALYFESAAMILTLVTVGKYLEARSTAKTSDALGKLMDLAPKTASVLRDGQEVQIPAEQVVPGDLVMIRPGEGIPVDGVVVEGRGFVDQAAITGESIPIEKNVGDTVISATLNKNGSFRFRASKVGEDTTLAQIIRLVDEAGNSKAPIARLADRVSGVFVPVVMALALVTAIVWLAVGKEFEFAFSNAIAVLVISCPCALGLATPVAIMVGTGKAAELGILIKSAESLENLHRVDTVVLDKTGTVTQGHPSVTDVLVLDPALGEEEFLAQAAALEAGSEHPLAQAVTEYAARKSLPSLHAGEFTAFSGRGVGAEVEGHTCLAGNLAFLREQGLDPADEAFRQAERQGDRLAAEGKTPLFFAGDGRLTGVIGVADTVRKSSREAIRRLTRMGLRVVLLTGDNAVTAAAIGREVGIGEIRSDVLPAQKEAHIRRLQEEGRRVAMVGDGINDAPALTRADIGIAIGAGTDIAVESADVVLMKDSLDDVATAIELSRAVVRNIHMNLFWAFFYNILGIPIAAGALFPLFGLRLSPMIGSAAMSLSSVCVVTNALRLRFFRPSTVRKRRAPDQGTEPSRGASPAAETVAEAASCPEEACGGPHTGRNGDGRSEKTILNRKGDNTMKKVLKVEGMMCAHCQMHVQKALEAVPGVQAVSVDLQAGTASVQMGEDVPDQTLMDAVTAAGYTAAGCTAE